MTLKPLSTLACKQLKYCSFLPRHCTTDGSQGALQSASAVSLLDVQTADIYPLIVSPEMTKTDVATLRLITTCANTYCIIS